MLAPECKMISVRNNEIKHKGAISMEKKKINIGVTDIILLVLSIVFLIGIRTFFAPCGPKDDGSWMTCHWAGQAITGIAAVLLVISVIHLLVKESKVKQGLAIAMIPMALFSAILPGNMIGLCMMNTMRCHSVMHPATIVMSVLMIAAAVLDLIMQRKKG